jgi:methionine-R-sulfoxide reductase
MYASIFGNSGTVALLLARGAEPRAVDGHGKSALDHARLEGHDGVVEALAAAVGGDAEDADIRVSPSGFNLVPMTSKEVERAVLAEKLNRAQIDIALEGGTEKAGTGRTTNGFKCDHQGAGVYVGSLSGLPLFSSEHRFESGTGWPSFTAAFDAAHVVQRVDKSFGMHRVEVLDKKSGAHLGHVFKDGPKTAAGTVDRFCINAGALKFHPAEDKPVSEIRFMAGLNRYI